MHRVRGLAGIWLLVFGLLLPFAAAADDAAFSEGLLWRVQPPGGTPSFVFGTLHSNEKSITALPPAVAAAFAGAGTVATEVILDQPAVMQLSRAMLMPAGEKLDAMLTPAQIARLKSVAAQYRVAFDNLTRFKPWAVMALFSFPPAEYARSAAGGKALDEQLQSDAQAAGKKLIGLETIDEQIDALGSASPADQLVLLDATLRQAPDIDDVFETLRKAYLARNVVAVRAALETPLDAADEAAAKRFESTLIAERNRRMAQRILPLLQQGNAFIAIGALHLPGDDGVLSLLAAQGCEVTRVY
jgi:uncharacterized protein